MAKATTNQNSQDVNTLKVVMHSLTDEPRVFKDVKYCTLDTVSGRIQILPNHSNMSTILNQGSVVIKGDLAYTSKESGTMGQKKGNKVENSFKEYKFDNIDALVNVTSNRVDIFII